MFVSLYKYNYKYNSLEKIILQQSSTLRLVERSLRLIIFLNFYNSQNMGYIIQHKVILYYKFFILVSEMELQTHRDRG